MPTPQAQEPSMAEALELDVIGLVTQQKELEERESELMQNPDFANFLKQQKEFQTKSTLMWETIRNEMELHNIKSIKGEWGYITLAERSSYETDLDKLPAKFLKKVADVKKIGAAYDLTGELPKGVTVKKTKYLTKKIK